tara:strand:+ start:1747 stop:2484 length:738 start_codon:yes stop_codon:yes gene_type:complete
MAEKRTLAQPASQPNEVTEAFAEFWAANLGVVATQATDSIKRTTEQTAYRATLGPVYELQRVFCMSGRQAEIIAKEFKGGAPRPETGELCMLILEHSADIERDPAALRARPDKALLAPFKRIAKDKGFEGRDEVAAAIVESLAQVSGSPAAQASMGPGRISLGGGNGEPLVLVPGVAWDAGFTQTLREAQSGHTQPLPQKSRAELISEAGLCFSNVQRTIGACHADGVEHARDYLARQKIAGTQR